MYFNRTILKVFPSILVLSATSLKGKLWANQEIFNWGGGLKNSEKQKEFWEDYTYFI